MKKINNICGKSTMVIMGILVCATFLFINSSSTLAKRDQIVLVWKADANTLDSHDTAGHHSGSDAYHIHEGLVTFDEQMKVHPMLAESWETKDGQTWTFKLRKGVKFHDGTPFNAEAVKYSFDRIRADRDPYLKKALKMRALSKVLKEVKVIDDNTVQLITKYPFGPLIYTLGHKSFSVIGPTAREKYKADYGNHPVGTGPYKFVSWRKGDRIILERYDEYWGNKIEPINRPKRVVIRAIPEDAARVMALETGEVDVITFVPIYEIDRLNKDPRFVVREIPSMTVIYFGMNHMIKPFNDVRVRRALNYAVDKKSIAQHIFKGHAKVPNSVTSPTAVWHAPGVTYPYNPAKAKKLLAEAGYPNGFKTRMLVHLGKYNMDREFVEFARKNLSDVGVDVELQQVEWATHTATLSAPPDKKDYDMWLRAWSPGTGESSYTLRATMHTDAIQGGWNWMVYKNPEVNRLIDQGLVEPDFDKAGKLFAKVQRIVTEDAVWIPLVVPNSIVAIRKDVHNVKIFPNEPVYVKDSYIK
jgi:peptide/nickel transport system substrate-binding protein